MVSVSEDHRFDAGAFVVLVFFLLGLAGGWVARLAEWNMAAVDLEAFGTKKSSYIE